MRAQGRRDLALQISSSEQTFSQMLFYRVSSVHPNCLCVSLHFSFSLDFVCRENIVAIHFFPEARSQRTLKLEGGIKALFCFSVLFFREYAARPGDVLLVFRVISPCNILWRDAQRFRKSSNGFCIGIVTLFRLVLRSSGRWYMFGFLIGANEAALVSSGGDDISIITRLDAAVPLRNYI